MRSAGGAARDADLHRRRARAAYNEALKAFKSKDWDDAKALFGEVKKLFPYTRYARLSELRLADIGFEQEKFAESTTAYREFIQAHRNDPEVEYARYRVTKALFRDIDDTIFLPPQEERDQATAFEAYKEIRGFLRDYPRSPHEKGGALHVRGRGRPPGPPRALRGPLLPACRQLSARWRASTTR